MFENVFSFASLSGSSKKSSDGHAPEELRGVGEVGRGERARAPHESMGKRASSSANLLRTTSSSSYAHLSRYAYFAYACVYLHTYACVYIHTHTHTHYVSGSKRCLILL